MLHLTRRCVHTTDDARLLLRELLRETAQSVAVVTALLPGHAQRPSASTSVSAPTYHGATLSSFSSVALDPLPLVAFSLRVPSRMASALNFHVVPQSSSSASALPSSSPSAHLVVNILSAAQPHVADRFARPDLHPRPFADPCVHWTTSQDGLPVLSGALGALSCRLIGPSVPLAQLGGSHTDTCVLDDAFAVEGGYSRRGGETEVLQASARLASELFIARVLRVERVPIPEDGEQDPKLYGLPLLYHRRRYVTVEDHTKL